MKIRLTIKVTDDARRCIAKNARERKSDDRLLLQATHDGMATRTAVIRWLEIAVAQAHASYEPPVKTNILTQQDYLEAVTQLRVIGWTDRRIRDWLLMNSAMLEGAKLKLGVTHSEQSA